MATEIITESTVRPIWDIASDMETLHGTISDLNTINLEMLCDFGKDDTPEVVLKMIGRTVTLTGLIHEKLAELDLRINDAYEFALENRKKSALLPEAAN